MNKVWIYSFFASLILWIGLVISASAQDPHLAPRAKDLLEAKNFVAVARESHYASTVPAQARADDRKTMVGMLHVFFDDLGGLAQAALLPPDSIRSGAGGPFVVLELYAGDASDWQAESARFEQHGSSYTFHDSSTSFALTLAYIRPGSQWELLDIVLAAPASDASATARLAEMQSKLLNYLREQSATHASSGN
ncbi:MAG TPA: hypothetical protein VK700_04105 [Steroidobacteraceae bacterium]|jgi:hypothetical protein|nr:hypothetical protein [Steroidobacteraceae bacterium]